MVQERGLKRSSQQLISDALCGSRSRSKTGAIDAHKFGALDGGMAEGQIQMLGASLDDLVRPAKNSWGGRGSRDQLAAQNPCRIITLEGLGPLKTNWVGKSSDFTNPFVCGPAGGKVKKMSASSALSHISTTIHIINMRRGSLHLMQPLCNLVLHKM